MTRRPRRPDRVRAKSVPGALKAPARRAARGALPAPVTTALPVTPSTSPLPVLAPTIDELATALYPDVKRLLDDDEIAAAAALIATRRHDAERALRRERGDIDPTPAAGPGASQAPDPVVEGRVLSMGRDQEPAEVRS